MADALASRLSATAIDSTSGRLSQAAQQLSALASAKGGSAASGIGSHEAHETLGRAASALAQQARTCFFLVDGGPSAADLAGGLRDLERAATVCYSWAAKLFEVVPPAVRRLSGPPCALVLNAAAGVAARAESRQLTPADVAKVERAAEALAALDVSASAACARLLRTSHGLVADALRELRQAVAPASGGGGGDPDDSDGGGDGSGDDEDDEVELLGCAPVAAPLVRLVACAAETIELAAAAGVESAPAGANDAAAGLLTMCGETTSVQVDALACAAYDDDAAALAKYAGSVGKLLGKLRSVLGQKYGLADDGRLGALGAEAEASAAALVAACAAVELEGSQA